MRHVLRVPPLLVALALLIAVALPGCGGRTPAGDATRRFDGVALVPPTARPQLTLTDLDGRPYDFAAETTGQLTLLLFGYTHCPDVCPGHLSLLARLLAEPGAPEATVVFVTVDPERDTPEHLRSYLGHFDPSFVGLTGSSTELAAAQAAAGVPVAEIDPSGAVAHAASVLAYTPGGCGFTMYPFGTTEATWTHDLPILQSIPDTCPGATP